MNTKILWKIEELWEQYYTPTNQTPVSIDTNYPDGVSRYHPRFHAVAQFDFMPSSQPIFSDDAGDYHGLAHCQVSTLGGKPVYLIDNHNEILYSLMEIKEATGTVYDIVHIDAHPDDALFQGIKKTNLNLKNIKEYIAETRISDFFDAVSEANVIGQIFRVCHSDSFEFFLPPDEPYILSLDIDIFGPEGDFVALQDKVRAIAQAWSRAEAVVIATSPGFIDQGFAQEIINIMTKS